MRLRLAGARLAREGIPTTNQSLVDVAGLLWEPA